MNNRGDTANSEQRLDVQLTRTIQDLHRKNATRPSIEQATSSLIIAHGYESVLCACHRVSDNLPAAISNARKTFEHIKIFAESSSKPANIQLKSWVDDIEHLSDRIILQWQICPPESVEADYKRLLDTTPNTRSELTIKLWQCNNLLTHLALNCNDAPNSRTLIMQAMFCARGLGDREKIARSEFALACSLSMAADRKSLRDNFVLLRNEVIGESSLLPLFQQQRVLMYSVRDYCRRDMLASAQSLLEIADGFAAQMLPMELAQLNVERARCLALDGNDKAAKQMLFQAKEVAALPCLVEESLEQIKSGQLWSSRHSAERRKVLARLIEQTGEASAAKG